MNKIYSVLRIDSWNNAQEVYSGRIRDCKKSLQTIGKEYRKRGWEVKNYDFTLILRSNSSDDKRYTSCALLDRKSTRLNSSHRSLSRMPSSA